MCEGKSSIGKCAGVHNAIFPLIFANRYVATTSESEMSKAELVLHPDHYSTFIKEKQSYNI